LKRAQKERRVAIVVVVGVLLLFILIAFIIVSHFQNIGEDEAQLYGQLELQLIHEQLYSAFSQQTMFLRFVSTSVTRELATKGAVDVEEYSHYKELLEETNEWFSSMLLIPRQDLPILSSAEFAQLEKLLEGEDPLFFGPYHSLNNEYLVTGCQAVSFSTSEGERGIWGFVIVTYNFDKVLQEIGVDKLAQDYNFSIRTQDSQGGYTYIFGDETLFEHGFVQMKFSFSLLNWELVLGKLTAASFWSETTLFLAFAVIVITLLMGWLSYNLAKRVLHIRRLAYSDGMTGVVNKTEFMRLLTKEMDLCNRTDSRLALALLDIDNFKNINDQYGHAEGDRALLALVQSMLQVLQYNDVLGRFGGDEFAILFRNMEVETAPYIATRRVFEAIGKLEIEIGTEMVEIKASMGVAISGIDGTDVQTLLQRADAALYTAKANGKNMLAFS